MKFSPFSFSIFFLSIFCSPLYAAGNGSENCTKLNNTVNELQTDPESLAGERIVIRSYEMFGETVEEAYTRAKYDWDGIDGHYHHDQHGAYVNYDLGEYVNEDELKSKFKATLKELKECLGSDWKKRSLSNSARTSQEVFYQAADKDKGSDISAYEKVIVYINSTTYGRRTYLSLSVSNKQAVK